MTDANCGSGLDLEPSSEHRMPDISRVILSHCCRRAQQPEKPLPPASSPRRPRTDPFLGTVQTHLRISAAGESANGLVPDRAPRPSFAMSPPSGGSPPNRGASSAGWSRAQAATASSRPSLSWKAPQGPQASLPTYGVFSTSRHADGHRSRRGARDRHRAPAWGILVCRE